jgi:hypothetical protein
MNYSSQSDLNGAMTSEASSGLLGLTNCQRLDLFKRGDDFDCTIKVGNGSDTFPFRVRNINIFIAV